MTPQRSRRPRGMVTMEIAMGVLVVAMLFYLCAFILSLFLLQDRAEATAMQVARQEARGDIEQARRARQMAPKGSQIESKKEKGWVRVDVTAKRRFPVIRREFTVRGTSTAPIEPGAM